MVGLGWALPNPTNRSIEWARYHAEAALFYGSAKELSRVVYLHDRVVAGDLLWIRDLGGTYYLARALAAWRYDDTQAAWNADVVNVVPCDIRRIGLGDAIPGKIVACFRPTRAIQQISDETVNAFSQLVWNQVSGEQTYSPSLDKTDLFALIGDQATEDLVLLYLQLKGWLVFASTRRGDTLAYEVILVHRDTGVRGVVQVKSGNTPLSPHDWTGRSEQVFLFQAHGRYTGGAMPGVTCIEPKEVLALVETRPEILPSAIVAWREFASKGPHIAGPSAV